MQNIAGSAILHFSPKRKRNDQDSFIAGAPASSRLRLTNLPIRPLLAEQFSGSPGAVVAGHLQTLDLDPKTKTPSLGAVARTNLGQGPSKSNLGCSEFKPHIFLPSHNFSGPVTPPPSSDGPLSVGLQRDRQDQPTTFPLEIPETPRLRPVSSPTPPPSVTKFKVTNSPPPSPSSTFPALWWNDDEITGHDPKDPSDDGYGINGVGFLPTPAIANARLERRKKQVAEWKSREAREARQKRSDRRRRIEPGTRSPGNPIVHDRNDPGNDERRKVRFLET